jgi:hypothetical protein
MLAIQNRSCDNDNLSQAKKKTKPSNTCLRCVIEVKEKDKEEVDKKESSSESSQSGPGEADLAPRTASTSPNTESESNPTAIDKRHEASTGSTDRKSSQGLTKRVFTITPMNIPPTPPPSLAESGVYLGPIDNP